MWFECTECFFATNSNKAAARHEDEKDHIVVEITDE